MQEDIVMYVLQGTRTEWRTILDLQALNCVPLLVYWSIPTIKTANRFEVSVFKTLI